MRKLGFKPQDLPGVSVSVLGYALSLPDVLIRALLGRIVARGRGTKKPSLSYDIGRGKSEVDWLNGAVVRYGASLGVRTPVNRALNEVMQEIVEDGRVHERYLNRPERLIARAYSSKGAT
jgi:2-dehydropantoate 2-reductase